jgi:hypothetical protein
MIGQSIIAAIIFVFGFSMNQSAAKCVHEGSLLGSKIKQSFYSQKNWDVHLRIQGRYYPLHQVDINKIQDHRHYYVQVNHAAHRLMNEYSRNPWTEYNKRYLPYYHSAKNEAYLKQLRPAVAAAQYEMRVIGKSVLGKNLHAIYPRTIDPNKKIILMLGRQHGDEGTQNYIIEGFLNQVFSQLGKDWRDRFQLFAYPMINPDGADKMTRYNSNGLDLNRQWVKELAKNPDEVLVIQQHLAKWLARTPQSIPVITLDMHGSFSKDFVFRVPASYFGQEYFNRQTTFINQLAKYDEFQRGQVELSKGHPQMARLFFGKYFNVNALTHETPRNISLRSKRSIKDLQQQGVDLFQAIADLY